MDPNYQKGLENATKAAVVAGAVAQTTSAAKTVYKNVSSTTMFSKDSRGVPQD